MEKVTINWREELIKLFPETTTREIPEGAVLCDVCGGIGLQAKGKILVGCGGCGGKGYKPLCKCGAILSGAYAKQGDQCQECKSQEYRLKCLQGEAELFQKAVKIPITEYKGLILHNDIAEEVDSALEYIMDEAPEDRPEYVWGTTEQNVLRFDIRDELKNRADNDGYEDMADRLDFCSPLLETINELINQWVDAQGSAAKLYVEDYKTALIIPEAANE